MMHRALVALGATAGALALSACADPDQTGAESAAAAGTTANGLPRTPWGDPDLRGMWPIHHLIGVPFQRPEEYGNRRELTDEEFAARVEQLRGRNERYEEEISSNKMGMGHWAEATEPQRLTSLLVYPENGRFPELTERGKTLAASMGSSWSRTYWDSPTDFDTWDRCITRGLPPSMFPFNYNNGIQIHQTPGYVVIRLEMIHEARIVPIDREPLDPAIKQWMGEPRGRFEGDTLVIETTNFNGVGGMTNVGIPGSPRGDTPTTENMRIVERLTRIDEDTIQYEMTVHDPEVLTSDWTAAYPMKRDPGYEFFEYACHEDNTAIRNFIVTSRIDRARQAEEGGE